MIQIRLRGPRGWLYLCSRARDRRNGGGWPYHGEQRAATMDGQHSCGSVQDGRQQVDGEGRGLRCLSISHLTRLHKGAT